MNYYSLIPSAPSYNPTAFNSCCRISSANHCGCRLFSGGFADIDEPYNPSKVEMTPLWRTFDRHRFSLWQRSRRRSGRGARSSLSRLASSQTGMSAGRNLMEWKSRRRDVPERLEPSLSDGAKAEEEGLDRFDCNVSSSEERLRLQ